MSRGARRGQRSNVAQGDRKKRWGLICGFDHFLPYLYVVFFAVMIMHRAGRDIARCKKKYGKDWDRYCEEVPYMFIPHVF